MRTLLVLTMLLSTSSASAQTDIPVNLDNFILLFVSPPQGERTLGQPMYVDQRRGCAPAHDDPKSEVCLFNVKLMEVGVSISVKGDPKTRAISYVGLMFPKVDLADSPKQRANIAGLYLIGTMRLARIFNPELSGDAKVQMWKKLTANAHKEPNEQRVGDWVYEVGDGVIFLAVAVEHAKQRKR